MEFDERKFLKTYRGTESFITNESKYYNSFLELLQNDELLEKIKFANDVLRIPPIKSFIKYERDYLKKDIFNQTMSANAKRGLGACFGYLYRCMYEEGYESKQTWFKDDDVTSITTASYFIKREK